MTDHRRRWAPPAIALLVAGGVAASVAAHAWYRTLTFDGPTGPHVVTWYDASGKRIADDLSSRVGTSLMHYSFAIGDRLMMFVAAPEGHGPRGVAWIRPAVGEARIAWPILSEHLATPEGLAVRDEKTFAVMIHSARDTPSGAVDYLAAGIAGWSGWLRAPVTVAEWVDRRDPLHSGRPLLLGMSWIDGELEVALTHPTADDPYGSRSPVRISRIAASGKVAVRSQPLGCDCRVIGALPRHKRWTLVVRGRTVSLSDPDGSVVDAPQLAGWDDFATDRSALGTLWALSHHGENRVERDGTMAQPTPPLPGWKPIISFERQIWLDGVVRTKRLWSPDGDSLELLAQHAGDRAILTASLGEYLQLVGDRPDRLRPAVHNSTSHGFLVGEFLPRAGGGFYWTTGQGEYVTLDEDLRRIDPLPLRHHLRTRGSVGDFIDESEHEKFLAWSLFGLPILAILGIALGWTARERRPDGGRGPWRMAPLIAALVLYAVTGAATLAKVLPLL